MMHPNQQRERRMSPETVHQTPNNKALHGPPSGISSRIREVQAQGKQRALSPEIQRPWDGSQRPHPHCPPRGLKVTPVAPELKLGNTAFVTMGTLATSTAQAGGRGYAPPGRKAQELGRHCSSLLPGSVTHVHSFLDPFPTRAITEY